VTDTVRPELGAAQRALLAQRLRRRPAAPPGRTVPVRPPGAAVPLSYAQERLWFLEQYQPGTTTYTVPVVVRVAGPLDAEAVGERLSALTARHEALRSRFTTTDDGRPELVLDPGPADFALDTADDLDAAMAAVDADLERPFDLERGPLVRVRLFRLGPADHVLLLAAHHTVVDGWSADLLLRALLDPAGGPAEPAPAIDYGDFALWQRSRDDARDVAYWTRQLADLPALDLPTDRPRPPEQRHDGAAVAVAVDAELTAALRGLARQHGATLYMTLLAAYALLLGRTGGQTDLGVASPVSGRGAPELDAVVGMFVNTVVVRTDLTGDPTFGELVERVRDTALDAFAHAELPFDRLVTELGVVRDVSRSPLAQTTFALQNFAAGPGPAPAGVDLTYLAPRTRTARYELGLYLFETDDGLAGQLTYTTALFAEDGVRRFADRFTALLRAAAADPTAPVTALPVLSDAERAEALAASRGPDLPEQTGLLHDVVAEQAARAPSATAVVDDVRSIDYAELDRLATGIAQTLRAHGAAPDAPVALLVDPSTDLAAAVIGVLRSGSPYLPLDPRQPAERLAFVLDDAAVRLVLTTPALRAVVPVAAQEVVEVPGTGLLLVRTGPPAPPVSVAAHPDHLAYVIYTSGTTGRPKGVAVAHRQAMTYVAGVADRLDPVPGARFTLLQSLSFDFGLTVFLLALRTGGSLRLADPRSPVEELAPLLASSDYVKITPSHLESLLLAVPPAELLPRRMLVLGGEATSWSRATELARHTAVVNHYGPTEATVGVCTHRVDPDADPGSPTVPIGTPLPGARVYLLDEQLRPTPPGMVGEIHLGGDRLARGYVGRPDLTAAAFLPDPYADRPGSRMYRTGDLGRRLPGGELVFLGRRDHQVKIRGYRVELAEVEATLLRVDGVAQAVVELRAERLVAYLVGEERPLAEVRAALARSLPEYMVPARVVWLDALPLKAHGKVDRARLPDPGDHVETEAAFVAPASDAEVRIAGVWADVLGLDRVGVDDDFFDLGGHSLLAAQVVARLRRAGGTSGGTPPVAVTVTLLDLFTHRTVRALAAAASGPAATGPARLLRRLTPARPVTRSVVCLPYGGGSAVIYQPLADALPADTALWSAAVPGHELGEEGRPTEEVVAACVQEVLDRVTGPVVLYGHCGLGVMLAVETARGLEAAGRPVEAVYLGGIFPFARPSGPFSWAARLADGLRSDRMRITALRASGLDTDGIDPEQLRLIVANRRRGTQEAERYFGRLTGTPVEPLTAPVVSVVGDRDPATEFYQERFREWGLLSPRVMGVVLDEAGHFYLKYRAAELAEILTVHHDGEPDRHARTEASSWWRHDVAPPSEPVEPGRVEAPAGPEPSMRRFGAVAAAQLVSILGSALTEFAVPVWIYTTTGSLVSFALLAVVGLVPGLLVAPLAGVLVDRYDRRRVMLWGGAAAGAVQLAFGVLLWTGTLQLGAVFALLALLSVALTFQRLAYQSSIAQLVPKRFLGHANGIVQMTTGAGQLVVPLVAVGLIATIGIEGVLVLDVVSYVVATAVVLLVRFPSTMAWRRREGLLAELRGGWRYTWGDPAFRAMLVFFAVLNLFVSPLFLMITPLVLDFAALADVGRVAFAGGVGVLAGGLVMAVWGGPRRRRMAGLLLSTSVLAACCLLTGLWPDLGWVTVGSFGMSMSLTVLNGIYATIIQLKVPQRFHGRVISLNTLVAWSTLPIGFGIIAPYGTALLGGRIGLVYVVCAAGIVAVVVGALRIPALRRVDTDMPDAVPDDLVGLDAVRDRLAAADRPGTAGGPA
jgi:amino acid adenylation domain-containing protein